MHHNTRLPTRVSTACDRCRKQKQRCDEFRPCTNCVHACAACTSIEARVAPEPKRPRKRLRTVLHNPSEPQLTTHERSGSGVVQPPQEDGIPYAFPSDPQSPLGGQGRTVYRSPSSLDHRRAEILPEGPHSNGLESWPADAFQSPVNRPQTSKSPAATSPRTRIDSPGLATLQAESAIDMTRRLFRHGSESSAFSNRATYAIPGGMSARRDIVNNDQVAIRDLVGVDLPDRAMCDSLLDTYFITVHWFSLVIFEPKFRTRYNRLIDNGWAHRSDRAYVLLLLMVLVMGCWYDASPELTEMRRSFLRAVREHFMDIIDEDSLEFVQLCALLGSFYLYHGRPRSSFSILGAATKTSQAIGLHREPHTRLAMHDAEERKRVWWTIYTWDRFATIIYGRPLGINDKDCNVTMPADIFEIVYSERSTANEPICLSTYQTQLNCIYQIASPVLENIYGIRVSTDIGLMSKLPEMIASVDRSLQQWKQALPAHLSYDAVEDICENSSTKDKLHALQALSLQLTHDNIMIVLHRTLLADQRKTYMNGLERVQLHTFMRESSSNLGSESNLEGKSFERCLDAALRISQTQRKPNLIALAQNTHLVSFLAMNLFTSSVVMSICALSDTMSDVAQEAKRGMSRTLHLLKKLSSRASLPMQCSMILEDLVGLILKKEKAAMLFGLEQGYDYSPRPDYQTVPEVNNLPASDEHLNADVRAPSTYRSRAASHAHPQAQTILDLQRIFEENSGAKGQSLPVSYPYADPQTGNYSGSFGFSDSANPNTEDLGQFWLWNMEPFQEDLLPMTTSHHQG